jgi:hypothetical protein
VTANSESLKQRFETGTVMSKKMGEKLEVSRKNLIAGEQILSQALEGGNN